MVGRRILASAMLCFLLQYVSEIRLEYDDGLQKYEDFIEEQVTENDAFIGPYTHTIFLNVYHPELHYYLLGYKLYSLPFVNTEALTNYSQLRRTTICGISVFREAYRMR